MSRDDERKLVVAVTTFYPGSWTHYGAAAVVALSKGYVAWLIVSPDHSTGLGRILAVTALALDTYYSLVRYIIASYARSEWLAGRHDEDDDHASL